MQPKEYNYYKMRSVTFLFKSARSGLTLTPQCEEVNVNVLRGRGLLRCRWRSEGTLRSRLRWELDDGLVCLAERVDAHPQVPEV